MLMIRLQRRGKKHQASYRLVVGEKRSKLKGKQLESVGWFDPHEDTSSFDKERILYWLKNGAQMSGTVNNLLLKNKIIEGKKVAVHKKSKKLSPESVEGKKEAAAEEKAGA